MTMESEAATRSAVQFLGEDHHEVEVLSAIIDREAIAPLQAKLDVAVAALRRIVVRSHADSDEERLAKEALAKIREMP